jgi:hypothetical protein
MSPVIAALIADGGSGADEGAANTAETASSAAPAAN